MPTKLWLPVPNADNSDGNWVREDTGTNTDLYSRIDEGTGTENSGIHAGPSTTTPQEFKVELEDTPADFNPAAISAASVSIRYKQSGWVDDTILVFASVKKSNGTTFLLGATGPGRIQVIGNSNAHGTTYSDNGGDTNPRPFTFIESSATKAEWDAALLHVEIVRTSSMSADSIDYFIDNVVLTITYFGFPVPEVLRPPYVPFSWEY